MNDRLIKESDVLKAIDKRIKELSKHPEFVRKNGHIDVIGVKKYILAIPSADRAQGYWTKTDVATYRCSECGKIQIADDINELNFCCCCGSRNKMRRLKGADDE